MINLVVYQFLLFVQSRWSERLRALLAAFPDIPLISMGFPRNWEDSVIWKDVANAAQKPKGGGDG